MINDNEHHQGTDGQKDSPASMPVPLAPSTHHNFATAPTSLAETPLITENVRATLSPLPVPHLGRSSLSEVSARSSTDVPRKSSWDVRRSMDASRTLRRPSHEVRRSFSGGHGDRERRGRAADRSPLSPMRDTESGTLSLDQGTESSVAIQSMDDSSASASQILNRSDVFRAPTRNSPGVTLSEQSEQAARQSQDTTRSSGAAKLYNPQHRSVKRTNTVPGATEVDDDTDPGQAPPRLSSSSSALQDIASYPLQKASGIAGFLRTRSKKMGNLLATESMGYYEKVSGMLAGGRKHYNTADGLEPHDQVHGFEDDDDTAKAAENFCEHFAFPETEILQSSFFASLQRVLPNYGKVYISGRYFCFRSLMPTSKTKVSLCPCFSNLPTYRVRLSCR
jgi:sterol 3beta-glucosyltransferase